MGVDLPSFLVNDKTIPRLAELPKTPGTGLNGPYPNIPRRQEQLRVQTGRSEASAKRDHKREQELDQQRTASRDSAHEGDHSRESPGALIDARRSSPRNTSSFSSIADDSEMFYTASSPSAASIHSTSTPQSSPVSVSNPPQLRRQTTVRPQDQNSSVTIPWDAGVADNWTADRVLWWLESNGFGQQWIEAFRRQNIEKEAFMELTSYRNVKRLGITESPARFIRLLRLVVPVNTQQFVKASSVAPSPTRVSAPFASHSTESPVSSESVSSGSPGGATTQQQRQLYQSGQIATTPTISAGLTQHQIQGKNQNESPSQKQQILHQLVGARRTSLEKFLFLDHRLRPKRNVKPGPSILVTYDDVSFRLVGITDSHKSADVRRQVYAELQRAPCTADDAALPSKIKFRLTDYYCEPGEALSDSQLWAVLSAAAGDIVKFNIEITDPRPLPIPSSSRTPMSVTPGWSSEEAMSPPGPLGQRMYPPTPAHLMTSVGEGDYFALKLPKNRGGLPLASSRDSRSRSSSSSSSNAAQIYGGGLHAASSSPNVTLGSSEQLVALRTAPKPPLARSASSKYRPELSPVISSSPYQTSSAFGEASKAEDEMWADAPELESDPENNGDANDDSGMWAKAPALGPVNKAPSSPPPPPPQQASNSSGVTTPAPMVGAKQPSRSGRSTLLGVQTSTPESLSEPQVDEEGESAPMLNSRILDHPYRKPRRRSEASFNPLVEEAEKEHDGDEAPVSLSLVVPPNGHSATPSESSIDSPRSPDVSNMEPSIDWASRPPAEVLYENLERFFPNTDLDKPVVVAQKQPNNSSLSTKPSSVPRFTTANAPRAAPPPVPAAKSTKPSPNTTEVSKESKNSTGASESTSAQREPTEASGTAGAAAPPSVVEHGTVTGGGSSPLASPGSGGVGRAKSIRVVAREASRRLRQGQKHGHSNLLRRKSTKMWGQRVVEMRKGTSSAVTLRDHKEYVWIKGEMIGQGSFGKVYLGLNATTGDMMAVKQVKAPRRGSSHSNPDDSMRALYAEVENMKDLDHLNIVQYLGFERLDRVSNLFLEYVPGGSVKSLLINFGRFPEQTIRFMIIQVLNGLSYLHSRGILHRDLKADNLLLDIDGTIKISDFGISKRSRDIYANNAEMSMQGTIFWMAPEVIHNVVKSQKQGYSAKVDIWSLGCVILEMFVGRRPWSTEEAIGAMYKLGSSRQAPPIPEDAKPYVSDEGKDFLDSCFVIDPNARPTAQELLDRKFCVLDPKFNFSATKLGVELKKSVKRTSSYLKMQNNPL